MCYWKVGAHLVIRSLAVLVYIESFFLFATTATQSDSILDGIEDDHAHDKGKADNGKRSESLYADGTLCSVEFWVAEYCSEDCTEDTAHAMNADCTNRIVNLEYLVDETYREAHCY